MTETTTLRALLTEQGQQALSAAAAAEPDEASFLPLFQRLSKAFPRELARAAIEQVLLREKALAKFPQAGRMFFLREALEQASSQPIAAWRSRRFSGSGLVFDMCCGTGGDALELALQAPVVAIDQDVDRLQVLQINADQLGREERLHCLQADVTALPAAPPADSTFFFDPARRIHGRRVHHVREYQPALSSMHAWLQDMRGGGVKVSPAVRLQELEGLDCEVEFISLGGQLKEAVLWVGALKSAAMRATLLPEGLSLVDPADYAAALSDVQAYLYEPDPAVLRAGLVRSLGRKLGLHQIDASIGLLTGDARIDSPFVRRYRLLGVLPNSLKKLRAELRARGIGKVTIKKRGSAVDVEEYSRKLRAEGALEGTLLLTRVQGRKVTLLISPDGARTG